MNLMNGRINQLVKSLLQKDSLEQCSLPELKEFAGKNPYFGAAQLLLAKKIKETEPEQYQDQLQKTLLYFNNPLWVEHLLNENGTAEIIKAEKEISFEESSVAEPVITESKTDVAEANEEQQQPITENNAPDFVMPELKIEPVVTENDQLLFEPFHTVDYFASQGIRFKEDEKPSDKFGIQLKSFTDWLKTMKKLPSTELGNTVGLQSEQKIEVLAGESITNREVITEAMAQVWEKQGNIAKSIDTYSKLSLLEPTKSPYFAAKIEELKKLN